MTTIVQKSPSVFQKYSLRLPSFQKFRFTVAAHTLINVYFLHVITVKRREPLPDTANLPQNQSTNHNVHLIT